MNIIVAITGASGAIYVRQVLDLLINSAEVVNVALVMSDNACDVIEAEKIALPESPKVEVYSNDDMWASLASGSARWNSMIIVPCSMGTVGRIASGVSRTLIERAADVMLKERRPLVIVVREAPYSLIHLRNLTTITEAGAIVLPASPSFYFVPQSIDELAMTVSIRAVEMLGLEVAHRSWGE